jgi:hypothetical protein
MMSFYYLHLWTGGELGPDSLITDRTVHPFIVQKLHLVIDFWPADDVFSCWPAICSTEKFKIAFENSNLSGLSFEIIDFVSTELNFQANYPDAILPKYFWVKVNGRYLEDDFFLWNRLYLIVSENGLAFLRNNGVINAESDAIDVSLKEYFDSPRKYFWMQEGPSRQYLIDMDNRRKKQAPEHGPDAQEQ